MASTATGPAFDPKDMIFRNLGRTGLKVSILGLGSWLTTGKLLSGDPAKETIKRAFEGGINFFDTAEGYDAGESETEMGRCIKELGYNRRELVISTKIFFGTARKDPNMKGLSRKHIIEGLEDSLARLQMTYVDVVFAHRFDVSTPVEEVVRAFNHCIDRGLCFYWGTSEWTAAQVEEAIGVAHRLNLIGPVVEQPHYSMLHRERFEIEYADLYKKYGYGTTIWSPLEFGILTGKYNDGIPADSRFATNKDFFKDTAAGLQSTEGKAKLEKVRKLAAVAEKLNTTQASLALAWCAYNTNVSTVLIGASKPEQVTQNLACLPIIKLLTPEILAEIDAILENKPSQPATYGR